MSEAREYYPHRLVLHQKGFTENSIYGLPIEAMLFLDYIGGWSAQKFKSSVKVKVVNGVRFQLLTYAKVARDLPHLLPMSAKSKISRWFRDLRTRNLVETVKDPGKHVYFRLTPLAEAVLKGHAFEAPPLRNSQGGVANFATVSLPGNIQEQSIINTPYPRGAETEVQISDQNLQRILSLFNRPADSLLDTSEKRAWQKSGALIGNTTENQWQMLEWHFRQCDKASMKFRHRFVTSLLNKWNAALAEAERVANEAGYDPRPEALLPAPPDGWEDAMRQLHPNVRDGIRWDELYPDIRKQIQELTNPKI